MAGSTKTIKFSLSTESISNAIKELESYKKSLSYKAELIVKKLAELGVDVAQAAFNEADYSAQDEAVVVNAEKAENGWYITANGKSVVFLEFGAGDATDSAHPMANNISVDISPGSYSATHGKQYSRFGSWHHSGEEFHEVVPVRGLHEADVKMRDTLISVAREVFSE